MMPVGGGRRANASADGRDGGRATVHVMPVTISGVGGLPEIEAGTDLATAIVERAELVDGDIVVVTSKVVSKAEGRTVELSSVTPSDLAERWAAAWAKDPRVVEIVLRESKRVVRQIGPVLITETHHGFVCANAGVDQSSSGASGRVVVLPLDPDGSARRMRARFAELGVAVAVDEFGAASGSLAQLGNIVAGEIKLDRTFFRGALTNPKQARILDAIVAMAHRLDIRVIANGVDTDGLLRFALMTDCDLVQGLHCGGGMLADEFAVWAARQANATGRPAIARTGEAAKFSAHDAS